MEILVILTLSFSLFLLMDPIGNVPLYLAILKDVDPKRQKKIIIRELCIAFGIIILFLFLGDFLIDLLHVAQPTIRIAGGIILFIIALRMIFPTKSPSEDESPQKEEPFIVPLAVPLVAGPSVLAATMIYAHQNTRLELIIALFIAWVVSMGILLSSSFLQKILGKRGIKACERLMGLILTLIAVQMLLEGIKEFFFT